MPAPLPFPLPSSGPAAPSSDSLPEIAWPDREFDLLLESVFESGEVPNASPIAPVRGDTQARARSDAMPSPQALGLSGILTPLVTDVLRPPEQPRSRHDAHDDARDQDRRDAPWQLESEGSRDAALRTGDVRRRALLRAIADLAETHAVAADLAIRQAAIDLPLDVPDPVFHAFDESISLRDQTRDQVHDRDRDQERRRERNSAPRLIVPDVIRTCRDRLEAYTDAADRMKLDIVATLFDHVLADDGLPTEVRNTLARLQLPVLRMALADDSFFASRTHPTRRLLDRLAQSCNSSQVDGKFDSDSGRALRAELERTVHAVVRGSSEDAGEHARLLELFESRLVEIAEAGVPMLALVPDQEDRDVLVIKATIQISQLLAGLDVDREIRFFLLDVWSRVLAQIVGASPASEKGDGRDATLARAKRLCADLAWSAAPKTTSGERARLAGLLPTMIEALRDGLAMIDYPRAEQDRFFADWARMLHVAVSRPQPGSQFAGDLHRPFRLAEGMATREPPEALDIDDFARRLREGSFGPEIPRAQPASGRLVVADRPGLRAAEEATPSMLSTAPREAVDTAGPPPAIADLKKGEWFELRDELRKPGGFVKVRLSWISPLRSFYLFIGADSALTRSFDPESLSELFVRGDLRPCKT